MMPSRTDQISAGALSAIQNSPMSFLGINDTNPSEAGNSNVVPKIRANKERVIINPVGGPAEDVGISSREYHPPRPGNNCSDLVVSMPATLVVEEENRSFWNGTPNTFD